MRTGIQKLLYGLGLAAFAGTFFVSNEIPSYPTVGEAGKYLLRDSGVLCEDGQDGISMVAELLGGQIYFQEESGGEDKIWEENQLDRESDEAVASGDERVLGDVYNRDEGSAQAVAGTVAGTGTVTGTVKQNVYVEKLKSTLDTKYLWQKFYIIDSTTSVTKDLFDVKTLLGMDMKMPVKKGKKQILIYHTHGASESFKDSGNRVEDSVVGVGTELAKELEKRGYGVIHDSSRYDLINGKLDRSLAYNKSLEGIQKIREKEKDIEVLIDLHRDSVGAGKHTYTMINGKKTAIVMFFNGMSRTKNGPIPYLQNPNLQGNLAFSLQLKCKAMECYDGFTKPIYLKGYRYNLHLEEKSLLIELGNENNTVAEAKNAAAPLADTIYKVLSGKN